MLSIDVIKNLGVDMSITKQDLIDLITQYLRDAADAELEEAQQAFNEAEAAKNAFYELHRAKLRVSIDDDPKVIAALQALEAVSNSPYKVIHTSNYTGGVWLIVPSDYNMSMMPPRSYVYMDFPSEPDYPKDEEAALIANKKAACDRYHTATRNRENLENNSNRAKAAFIRELLGASEDGKLLLSVLDAKTAKAGIRKLKEKTGC